VEGDGRAGCQSSVSWRKGKGWEEKRGIRENEEIRDININKENEKEYNGRYLKVLFYCCCLSNIWTMAYRPKNGSIADGDRCLRGSYRAHPEGQYQVVFLSNGT
jgi:hypothetical protein